MNEDMSDMIKNLSKDMPDDIKNIINNFSSNNKNSNAEDISSANKHSTNTSSSESNSDIDIGMILKMKKIMDSMKNNKDDPRANLLLSLKPYLKNSRQEKVDQYIKLFNMSKVFEVINPLGGDNKNGL